MKLLIQHGRVIDPANQIDAILDGISRMATSPRLAMPLPDSKRTKPSTQKG